MPNLDDFHAFKSTSGGAGGGCSTPIVIIGIIISILYLIGKCA